jgi:hypothetical protein
MQPADRQRFAISAPSDSAEEPLMTWKEEQDGLSEIIGMTPA